MQVNLTANTDLQHGRGVQEAGDPRAGRRAGPPGGRRRRRARRRRTTTRTCASPARRPSSWASGCCRTPTRSTSSSASATEMTSIQAELPAGMQASIAYDSTEYIEDAIDEVAEDAERDGPDRDRRDLPVPRLAALGAGAGGRHPGLADRRRLPDAGVRLHAEPADAAGDRAVGRPGRRRRDRRGRERRAPHARGARRRSRRRSIGARELVGPDHRHDHHAGGGLRADRLPGRPDRRAVPRVRLHAGRRGLHLGRRGADAVADDVLAAAARRATTSAASPGYVEPALRGGARRLRARRSPATLRCRPGGATRCGSIVVAADRADVHVLGRRSWRRTRTRASCSASSRRPPNATLEQTQLYSPRGAATSSSDDPGVRAQLPDHVPDRRLRRHGREAVERAQADDATRSRWSRPASSPSIAGVRAPVFLPPALPERRRLPGRARDRVDGRAAAAGPSSPNQLVRDGRSRAGSSPSRRRRRRSRPGEDRDRRSIATRCASHGPDHEPGRARDLSAMLGGNFVNRFNIDGRSYKVIPQVERSERLTPEQLARHPRHGPGRQAHAALGGRDAADARPSRARSTASSSSTRSRSRACPAARLARQALWPCSRTRPRAILPPGYHARLHRRVAPAPAGGRQVPARRACSRRC